MVAGGHGVVAMAATAEMATRRRTGGGVVVVVVVVVVMGRNTLNKYNNGNHNNITSLGIRGSRYSSG